MYRPSAESSILTKRGKWRRLLQGVANRSFIPSGYANYYGAILTCERLLIGAIDQSSKTCFKMKALRIFRMPGSSAFRATSVSVTSTGPVFSFRIFRVSSITNCSFSTRSGIASIKSVLAFNFFSPHIFANFAVNCPVGFLWISLSFVLSLALSNIRQTNRKCQP